ncbi:cupin domain-containing protein [Sulfitobacter sp. SK012]|uniref:(R)-mandelonitrile lyase n=1 Tax=Sulfitobacter sp. SK012 TaxID=1389005 RepID=UPI000E0B68B5|nr:cupin domain-containing protein [Sulfitobacter sp. SK012]AXI45397.1 cupin domain-containing protein [Sulfitobacter sp. SK012]
MIIHTAGSRPPEAGPSDYFTGTVQMDPLISAPAPARLRGVTVTFSAGARTAWHTHPLGQTLIVTSGTGQVQKEGEAIQAIHPGDVVWIAPGEKHWHGATPNSAMTHIALQEADESGAVTWMEQVTDAQFNCS